MGQLRLGSVSIATQNLIGELRAPGEYGWPWQRKKILNVLHQIGESGEPAAISQLMPFAFADDSAIREHTRAVIHRLFGLVPWEGLPTIDDRLRSCYALKWHEMEPGQVEKMDRANDADRLCVGLLSCHRSGYTRWEAVRALADEPVGLAMPFLVMRMVDWVPQVRALAEEEFRRKLQAENAAVVVKCFGLMERLSAERRFRQEYWEWVGKLLQRPECAEVLKGGMGSAALKVRRRCFRFAAKNPALAGSEVLRQALSDSDVITRMWAISSGAAFAGVDEAELMRSAARDPYSGIRWLAFEYFKARGASGELKAFLLDRCRGIRRACQAQCERPVCVYREVVREGHGKAEVAVLGLGETGDASDVEVVRGMLGHRSATVRSAAIRALKALGVKDPKILLPLVAEDVPSVARQAAWTLMDARAATPDALWEAAKKNRHPQIRIVVLGLLLMSPKWARLQVYLEAAGSAEETVSKRAVDMLGRWRQQFNDSFAQPEKAELVYLRGLLGESRGAIPAGMYDELASILKAMGC
jgi:HEAT repeat protein